MEDVLGMHELVKEIAALLEVLANPHQSVEVQQVPFEGEQQSLVEMMLCDRFNPIIKRLKEVLDGGEPVDPEIHFRMKQQHQEIGNLLEVIKKKHQRAGVLQASPSKVPVEQVPDEQALNEEVLCFELSHKAQVTG